MTKELKEGDRAPAFTLPTDSGGNVALGDMKGKTVVLYFYPKDDTPGCTKEAIDFTKRAKDFKKIDAVVIGASKDPIEKHNKFKEKHKLGIALASDETGRVLQKYGVWKEKSNYGRKYMGIERSTFLIDGSGKIRKIWRKVRVSGHVDAVFEAAREI